MKIETSTNQAILSELGQRVQGHRLNLNMTQEQVALLANISRRALQNLEGGHSYTASTWISVLRVLGQLHNLDSFLPKPGISPLQLARLKGYERKRASGGRN